MSTKTAPKTVISFPCPLCKNALTEKIKTYPDLGKERELPVIYLNQSDPLGDAVKCSVCGTTMEMMVSIYLKKPNDAK